MMMVKLPKAGALRYELSAVASVELGDVLESWPVVSLGQALRLRQYLVSELGGYGMLSVEKARECGESLGKERAEARRVLAAIEKGLPW